MRPYCDDRREALRGEVRAWGARLPRLGTSVPDDQEARRLAAQLGRDGILAHVVPAAFGGCAPTIESLSLVVVREELAGASPAADSLFAVQGLAAHVLAAVAPSPMSAHWLPALAAGSAIGAFAVTEAGSGSDPAAMTATARRDGDEYVLDGTKVFISNAPFADVLVVFARTAEGARGVSAFAVPGNTPGLERGHTALLSSHAVGVVKLRAARIPATNRLGNEGDGLALCLSALETFRPTVGASACGMARRALDEACARTRLREQFGRPLAEHQSVAFTLAELATQLEAARGLVYRAAWLKDAHPHERFVRESSMAKLFATEAAGTIVDRALQLHGAAGLVAGSVMETLYREVRALRIYEGTSEIQKLIIARDLLSDDA